MLLTTLENVMVAVAGLPPESVVSLDISEDGLHIGGYGMLPWAGSEVEVEDRSPQGLRIRIGAAAGVPSTFFIPARSLPAPRSIPMFAAWLEGAAAQAGAAIAGALVAGLG